MYLVAAHSLEHQFCVAFCKQKNTSTSNWHNMPEFQHELEEVPRVIHVTQRFLLAETGSWQSIHKEKLCQDWRLQWCTERGMWAEMELQEWVEHWHKYPAAKLCPTFQDCLGRREEQLVHKEGCSFWWRLQHWRRSFPNLSFVRDEQKIKFYSNLQKAWIRINNLYNKTISLLLENNQTPLRDKINCE